MTSLDEYFRYQRDAELKYGQNTIVLYENGHFYEIYGIENETEHLGKASKMEEILNLKKTRKNTKILENSRSNPLLIGFPSHSLQKYLNVLMNNNFTVVMVEQTTPPPNPNRGLTRVFSPGTYLPEQPRPDYQFIVCIYGEGWNEKNSPWYVVMTALDISTGRTFHYTSHSADTDTQYVLEDIYRVLEGLNPKELLLWMEPGETPFSQEKLTENWELERRKHYWMTPEQVDPFRKLTYQESFLEEFYPEHGMLSVIEYLGMERSPTMIIAYCLILQFGKEHNQSWLNGLNIPETWDRDVHLLLHYNTIYQLNLLHESNVETKNLRSIYDLLDETATATGKRLLRERILNPIVNPEWLEARYQRLTQWMKFSQTQQEEIRRDLRVLGDLERYYRRIQLTILNPMECACLKDIFFATERILSTLQNIIQVQDWGWTPEIYQKYTQFKKDWENHLVWEKLMKYHLDTLSENIFHEGKEPSLDDLQKQYDEAQMVVIHARDKLLAWARKGDSKADESYFKIDSNERDGCFIGMTKKRWQALEKFAPKNHGFEVKNLPASGVKITNAEMEEASETIAQLQYDLGEACRLKYKQLLLSWSNQYQEMWRIWAKWEAEIDLLSAFGRVCLTNKYVRPKIQQHPQSFFDIKGLRHPLVERIQDKIAYIPNDVSLNGEGLLVFGLNGGGKSSLLKAIGVSIVLAQMGMFVPADSFIYYPFTAIHTRILGTDNILKGLSSFMIEMQEMRTILREANTRTLVLGDEICRGTEVSSAVSIVAAAIESLADRKSNFVFATHLHSLNEVVERKNLKWKHVEVSQDADGTLIFGRKLLDGVGPSTYGLEVAKCIIGDTPVIQRAIQIRQSILSNQTTDRNQIRRTPSPPNQKNGRSPRLAKS